MGRCWPRTFPGTFLSGLKRSLLGLLASREFGVSHDNARKQAVIRLAYSANADDLAKSPEAERAERQIL